MHFLLLLIEWKRIKASILWVFSVMYCWGCEEYAEHSYHLWTVERISLIFSMKSSQTRTIRLLFRCYYVNYWSASWSTDRANVPNEILIISAVVTPKDWCGPLAACSVHLRKTFCHNSGKVSGRQRTQAAC